MDGVMRFKRARTILRCTCLALPLLLLSTTQTFSQTKISEPISVTNEAPGWGSCGAVSASKNDLESYCLKGNVRTVRTTSASFEMLDGRWVEAFVSAVSDATFDASGRKTEGRVWDAHSDPRHLKERRIIYEHDDAGRPLGSKAYQGGSAKPQATETRSYDERGRLVRQENYFADNDRRFVSTYSYDGEGRQVGHVREDQSDGVKRYFRVVSSYEGSRSHYVTYSEDGTPYAAGDRLHNGRGECLEAADYQLDAQGNQTLLAEETCKYDARGRLAETIHYDADARSRRRMVYGYDDKGHVTSVTRYTADGAFGGRGLVKYKLDAGGNWVELVELYQDSEKDEPRPIIARRRVITYR